MNYLEQLREYHAAFLEPEFGPPCGASLEEIAALEDSIGFELPEAYREYLSFMGKDYDGILRGSDCFINNVIDNNGYLPELLQENGLAATTRNACVWFLHQGYIALWFDLPAEGQDPELSLFTEVEAEKGIQKLGTFSSVL